MGTKRLRERVGEIKRSQAKGKRTVRQLTRSYPSLRSFGNGTSPKSEDESVSRQRRLIKTDEGNHPQADDAEVGSKDLPGSIPLPAATHPIQSRPPGKRLKRKTDLPNLDHRYPPPNQLCFFPLPIAHHNTPIPIRIHFQAHRFLFGEGLIADLGIGSYTWFGP